jgi:BASS family bile acid:Na+ symporter
MLTVLAWVGRRGAAVLAIGVFLGLAWADLASFTRPYIAAVLVVLMTASFMRLDWPTVRLSVQRPKLMAATVVWLMLATPLAAGLIAGALGAPSALRAAVALYAASPVLMAATALALLLGLDAALALVVVIASSILVPATAGPVVLALLGIELDISAGALSLRLAALIGGSLALGVLLRRWLGAARVTELAAPLDGVVVVALLAFAVAAMDGVQQALIDRPAQALTWLGTAFLTNFGLQLLGAAAFRSAGNTTGATIGLASGNRNMGTMIAAMGDSVDSDIFLYFALGQIPIYLAPALLKPLYRRAMSRGK